LQEKTTEKIVLPDEVQKSMLKFFMKTSIPRLARQKREKALAEKEKQEQDDLTKN